MIFPCSYLEHTLSKLTLSLPDEIFSTLQIIFQTFAHGQDYSLSRGDQTKLGPTLSLQYVLAPLSTEVKRPGNETDYHLNLAQGPLFFYSSSS